MDEDFDRSTGGQGRGLIGRTRGRNAHVFEPCRVHLVHRGEVTDVLEQDLHRHEVVLARATGSQQGVDLRQRSRDLRLQVSRVRCNLSGQPEAVADADAGRVRAVHRAAVQGDGLL